jgi:hypothetical protein
MEKYGIFYRQHMEYRHYHGKMWIVYAQFRL